ncbi:MAG: ChbG/HpnK family deacetylase [Magnetococcales bacterium]|nr:ChbG/HpnK family deacetylase [Magnetococcales bacterium]
MNAQPRLIVNADDFGLSTGVNRGIVECYRNGIVRSATLMANMHGFDDAVERARNNPGLGVGVHLNLSWGRPIEVPERVPSLLTDDGRFPGTSVPLVLRSMMGKLRHRELVKEFRAQIRRVRAAGIIPTHVDTHKHLHLLPIIFRAAITAALREGINAIRLPRERLLFPLPHDRRFFHGARRLTMTALCMVTHRYRSQRGMRTPDNLSGIGWEGRLDEHCLSRIVSSHRSGVLELMVHPGFDDSTSQHFTRRGLHRKKEIEVLTNPRCFSLLSQHGIKLVHYGTL